MKTFMRTLMMLAAALSFVFLTACAALQPPPDQLYRDLGGQPGVEIIVDNLLDNIAQDDRIFSLFKDTNIDHFRQMLIEQFCHLSGGPCAYTGETMEKSHGGMHITEAQFNALVEDLYRAMERAGTPVAAQNRLVAVLAPMRPQIIYQ
ncbi:MAG: group 1 truncated hemoglobin [Spongiibacteraceae bacterium]